MTFIQMGLVGLGLGAKGLGLGARARATARYSENLADSAYFVTYNYEGATELLLLIFIVLFLISSFIYLQ